MRGQTVSILRRIAPWLLESNSSRQKYRTNYKGVHGRVGIVGGARDYAGAPYFASMSALRLGADLAYVICSQGASQVIKGYSPDLIVMPLLDCPCEKTFDGEMDCLLSRLHALVIGPGLGREELAQARARKLIEMARARSMSLVLDADSLVLVNEEPSMIRSYPKALLTPNRVELQRMLERLFAPQKFDLRATKTSDIKELVARCSRDLQVTILAKGMVDIVSDGMLNFNLATDETTGSNRRAGGQGDITSGLAGVYSHWIEHANKGLSSNDRIENGMAWAGYLAAATTRRSNELAHADLHGAMLASDMIDRIHPALRSLMSEEEGSRRALAWPEDGHYAGSLSRDEINRYRRQMIMEEFGPARQVKLRGASALIVGAGGLGCPAAVYLGAGGLGRLGVVDDDVVEASNLHRQILHNMDKVGRLKTDSIKQAVGAINPNVSIECHSVKLDRWNAVDLVERYDVILDCTDNLTTRYLINDACVVARRPLVSGAALKMDGQLTVYNFDADTPCFRCLFPEPPPPSAVGSCSDNGVLGILPGVVGVHQALEALKIGAGLRPAYAGKMLLFDGQLGLFRHITLAKKRPDCEACGSKSTLGRDLIDYEQFCGSANCSAAGLDSNNLLESSERITVEEYASLLKRGRAHVLVDVRPASHSDVSRLKHAIQLPVMKMMESPEEALDRIGRELDEKWAREVFVVCRKGIASQRGAQIIKGLLREKRPEVVVKDLIGGMTAWASRIDPDKYSCL